MCVCHLFFLSLGLSVDVRMKLGMIGSESACVGVRMSWLERTAAVPL